MYHHTLAAEAVLLSDVIQLPVVHTEKVSILFPNEHDGLSLVAFELFQARAHGTYTVLSLNLIVILHGTVVIFELLLASTHGTYFSFHVTYAFVHFVYFFLAGAELIQLLDY
jgi:hypothetical protein